MAATRTWLIIPITSGIFLFSLTSLIAQCIFKCFISNLFSGKMHWSKVRPSGRIDTATAVMIIGEKPAVKEIITRAKAISKNAFKKSGRDTDHRPPRMFLIEYSLCGKRSKK